jgi:hypothetical protein
MHSLDSLLSAWVSTFAEPVISMTEMKSFLTFNLFTNIIKLTSASLASIAQHLSHCEHNYNYKSGQDNLQMKHTHTQRNQIMENGSLLA